MDQKNVGEETKTDYPTEPNQPNEKLSEKILQEISKVRRLLAVLKDLAPINETIESNFSQLNREILGLGESINTQISGTFDLNGVMNNVSDLTSNVQHLNAQFKAHAQALQVYEQGYSNFMVHKFINRFARVYDFVDSLGSISDEDKKNLKMRFEDAFDQTNVEFFSPDEGINFLDNVDLLEEPPTECDTDEKEKDFMVKSITRKGIRSMEQKQQIIRKAIAEIWRFRGEKK